MTLSFSITCQLNKYILFPFFVQDVSKCCTAVHTITSQEGFKVLQYLPVKVTIISSSLFKNISYDSPMLPKFLPSMQLCTWVRKPWLLFQHIHTSLISIQKSIQFYDLLEKEFKPTDSESVSPSKNAREPQTRKSDLH